MELNFVEEDILKLSLSLLAGAVVGAEREYKNKNAGFRTIILVTVGATLFTMVSGLVSGGRDFHVVGNIVVGIGFLGAGSIFKEGSTVKGLTTAATIWISAAIGMSIGAGQYALAITALSLVIIVLLGFIGVQGLIDQSNREKTYKITIPCKLLSLDEIAQLFTQSGVKGHCVYRHKIADNITLTYLVKGPEKNHNNLITLLENNAHIIEFEV